MSSTIEIKNISREELTEASKPLIDLLKLKQPDPDISVTVTPDGLYINTNIEYVLN